MRTHKSVGGWVELRDDPYIPIRTLTTSGDLFWGQVMNDFWESRGQRPPGTSIYTLSILST